MASRLFKHIGTKLKAATPWVNVYSVNCIQLPNGRVVNLVGNEKTDFSLNDASGNGFYIRTVPKFLYTPLRQLSSTQKDFLVTVPFRFVFYSINQDVELDPLKLENIFTTNLRQLSFLDYTGSERFPEITILSSNVDSSAVFLEEVKQEREDGTSLIAILIEGHLKFTSTNDNCDDDCGIATYDNILNTFDFCDPNVFSLLTAAQKACLTDCSGTYNIYIDGELNQTGTSSDLTTEIFNISL